MSTETVPTPVLPIPLPAPEPPPRYRWVPALGLGIAIGAIIGGGITFTLMALSTRTKGDLVARQFDITQAIANTPGAQGLHVNGDVTNELGTYIRRSSQTNAIRRRITIYGQIPDNSNAGTLASNLKNAIDAEITRRGAWSSGGGSSQSSGGNEFYGSFDSTYYTRDGRRGQIDFDVVCHGPSFRATILLFEAK